MARRFFPDKVLAHAGGAPAEELPVLLDHLDAYVAGVKEAAEIGRIGRGMEVEGLIRDAHEARRQIQAMLTAKGWRLLPDAKTWVPS